jgi:K+-transporting ATPase ATPase C chain
VQNALDQAPRVARARHLPAARVLALVQRYTQGREWGFIGESTVNVLELNRALDGLR